MCIVSPGGGVGAGGGAAHAANIGTTVNKRAKETSNSLFLIFYLRKF